jgi:hypothetical protein
MDGGLIMLSGVESFGGWWNWKKLELGEVNGWIHWAGQDRATREW